MAWPPVGDEGGALTEDLQVPTGAWGHPPRCGTPRGQCKHHSRLRVTAGVSPHVAVTSGASLLCKRPDSKCLGPRRVSNSSALPL